MIDSPNQQVWLTWRLLDKAYIASSLLKRLKTMKTHLLIILMLFIVFSHNVKANELILKKPSLIIVYPLTEKTASDKEDEGSSEADADFYYYAAKIHKNMASIKSIDLVNSKANLFRFANNTQKPISRKDLEWLGFIFYKPNSKPLFFKGVATDSDVICQAVSF